MIIQKTNSIIRQIFSFLIVVIAATWSGCAPDLLQDEMGIEQFDDAVLNLNLPTYQSLFRDGGYVYLNDIGARGVIVYRKSASEYLAFERNCSFQSGDACSTVEVHPSTLYMIDNCCGSTFNFSGSPSGGPAFRELRQYFTSLSGSTLTITDEII